jgi:DNA-binding GntR family transcriptional regulator
MSVPAFSSFDHDDADIVGDNLRIMFQFFRLSPDEGSPSFPDSQVLSTGTASPTKTEKEALGLGDADEVIRIERIRSLSGQPILIETITLPSNRFPDFDHLTIIPTMSTGSIPNAGASPSAAQRNASRPSPPAPVMPQNWAVKMESLCC